VIVLLVIGCVVLVLAGLLALALARAAKDDDK